MPAAIPFLVTVLLSVVFGLAGTAKLIGHQMAVATFENLGAGQWLRIVVGAAEVGGAVALWRPAWRRAGALTLAAVGIGAVGAHVFVFGPPVWPALVLTALSLWRARCTP